MGRACFFGWRHCSWCQTRSCVSCCTCCNVCLHLMHPCTHVQPHHTGAKLEGKFRKQARKAGNGNVTSPLRVYYRWSHNHHAKAGDRNIFQCQVVGVARTGGPEAISVDGIVTNLSISAAAGDKVGAGLLATCPVKRASYRAKCESRVCCLRF